MGAGTSLITSGAGATVTTALGIAEYYEGKKMLKKAAELEAQTERPVYEIPASVQAYLTTAQKQALQGMPEQQRQLYLDQIQRNASFAIAGNVDRSAGLQGVSAASQSLNDANANLLAMDNQQRQANIDKLQQARLTYGIYEDQAFDYNENQPYQLKAAAVRALKGAGEQAKYAGAQTVANAGSNFAGQAGTAMNTIDTQGDGYTYESKDSPYYTGYGRRGSEVQPMNTIKARPIDQNPYNYDSLDYNY